MNLYNKYRPSRLEEIFGNEVMKRSLTSILGKKNKPRAFIIEGMTGCGKTSTARIIAGEFGAQPSSITEINGSNNTSVDDARKMEEDSVMLPIYGGVSATIFDEAHNASKKFWDCLLKLTEEPPEHCVYIFCTTELKKIPMSIQNRCQILSVKPLVAKELGPMLQGICKKEGKPVDKSILQSIIKKSEGSARWAITLLESIIDVAEEDRMGIVQDSVDSDDSDEFRALLDCILTHASWDKMSGVLSKFKDEPEATRYKILYHLGNKMLNGDSSIEHVRDCVSFFEETFDFSGRAGFIGACYDCSNG